MKIFFFARHHPQDDDNFFVHVIILRTMTIIFFWLLLFSNKMQGPRNWRTDDRPLLTYSFSAPQNDDVYLNILDILDANLNILPFLHAICSRGEFHGLLQIRTRNPRPLQKFDLIVSLKREISEFNAVISYQARIRSAELEALLVIDQGTHFITPLGTQKLYVQVLFQAIHVYSQLCIVIFLIIFFPGARKKMGQYQSITHRPKPWE